LPRPPRRRPPSPRCPAPGMGAPHWCAGWAGSAGRVSLHRGRRGPRFAAVAASEPQWCAAWARDGQLAAERRGAVAALRAAPTGAGRPVARRYAAPRAERPRREAQAPGEAREPHELRGRQGRRAPLVLLLLVSRPLSAVARLRLSPAPRKR